MDICCAYFRGKFHMREYGNAEAPFLEMGNVSAFDINHEVTSVVQEDFTQLGGNACAIDYIQAATLNMTLNCLKKENLAIAFQGTVVNLPTTAVVDEEHEVVALGSLIPLAFIPQKSTVVVTDDGDPGTTFTVNVDYIVTSAGIVPLAGGAIQVADTLLVSYSYGVGSKVEGITTGQKVYEIIFDGTNYGEDGEQEVVMRVWRVKFGPAATISLLTSGEMVNLPITAQILKDDTKVGAGVSKYYNFESREIA